MVSNALKSLPLAILLAATALTARGDEPSEKETKHKHKSTIVVSDDGVFTDGDDGFVMRLPGHGRRGYLGVRLLEMTPELRTHFGAPKDAGVLVASVEADSPAQKAGVQVGDIITKAGGETIESPRDLAHVARGMKSGETLKIDVSRDKAAKQLSVTIEERAVRGWDLGELHDLGDLGREISRDVNRDLRRELPRAWSFRTYPENYDRFQERLDELEKRLKDLEKRSAR
ncbi:MAG TPA: PDZ domain-containing protein [Thermoanaerobaculia bacterium]|nr:PDZ domain-containing protein [Thermoanaerobaculia bacterium]